MMAALAGEVPAQDQPTPTFGTTVVSSSGFRGQIYHLKPDTDLLPRLDKMRSVGAIYTTVINVPLQAFQQGFPGVTDRFEWFAILYSGRIWVEKEGRYVFSLLSDDGSWLKIDKKMIVDNDGIHSPSKLEGSAVLTRGVHQLEIAYFQGPRFHVALELGVIPPGEGWRLLNTDDFPAPAGSALVPGKIRGIRAGSNLPEVGPTIPRRW